MRHRILFEIDVEYADGLIAHARDWLRTVGSQINPADINDTNTAIIALLSTGCPLPALHEYGVLLHLGCDRVCVEMRNVKIQTPDGWIDGPDMFAVDPMPARVVDYVRAG